MHYLLKFCRDISDQTTKSDQIMLKPIGNFRSRSDEFVENLRQNWAKSKNKNYSPSSWFVQKWNWSSQNRIEPRKILNKLSGRPKSFDNFEYTPTGFTLDLNRQPKWCIDIKYWIPYHFPYHKNLTQNWLSNRNTQMPLVPLYKETIYSNFELIP